MPNFDWLTSVRQLIRCVAMLFPLRGRTHHRVRKISRISDTKYGLRVPASLIVGLLCVSVAHVAAAQTTSCPASIVGGEAGGMPCPSGLPTDTMSDYVQACLDVLAASQLASQEFSSVT